MSLKDYLPSYYHDITEMMSLLYSEDKAFEVLDRFIAEFPQENAVLTCGEDGLKLWEEFLGITPLGNINQRKMQIIALLRGQGQLNEEKIKAIVNSFTGSEDSAVVDLSESTLRVRVLPPEWGEIYNFSEIVAALEPRIPAHLGLRVERFYYTWQNISAANNSWGALRGNYENWAGVKNKV